MADDTVQTVNLGHAGLHATPAGYKRARSGKLHRRPIKGTVCLEFGRMIREVLGVLLNQIWTANEREQTKQARARDAINAALQGEPLA